MLKKIANIGGIFSGILSVVLSLSITGMSVGGTESYISYGGDAYTGIQNASAHAANNVYLLNKILQTGFSYLLLVIGIALICFFLGQLVKDIEATKKANAVNETIAVSDMPVV